MSIASTQAALGRVLLDLTRQAPDAARRVVPVSPDVSSSTNLGGWINKVGVPRGLPQAGRRRRVPLAPHRTSEGDHRRDGRGAAGGARRRRASRHRRHTCRRHLRHQSRSPFEAILARQGRADAPTWILDQVFPASRATPLVTVLDGHPHTLAFLATINQVPSRTLGVTRLGQSGTVPTFTGTMASIPTASSVPGSASLTGSVGKLAVGRAGRRSAGTTPSHSPHEPARHQMPTQAARPRRIVRRP